MKNVYLNKISFCAIFTIVSAFQAFGQMMNGGIYSPNQFSVPVYNKIYDSQYMTNLAVNGMMRSAMIQQSTGGRNNSRTVPARKDPLQFAPSGVEILSDKDLTQMTGNEQQKKALEAFLNNALSDYTKVAKYNYYAPNDLAYAFDFFIVRNYHAYKNVLREYKGYKNRGVIDLGTLPDYIDSDHEKIIYRQFRAILAANPAIIKMTDQDKERLTAYLVLTSNVPYLMYDAAITAGDDAAIEKARQMARQNLQAFFGASPDQISIDASGVRLGK